MGAPESRGQQPIKVDVNMVNVAFTAKDAQGRLVENLKREDVELLEDAVPQKIEFLQFSKANSLLIHQLVQRLGLRLAPRGGCANCAQRGTLARQC